MKKIFMFALVAILSVTFVACNDDDDDNVEWYTSLVTVDVPNSADAPAWFPIGGQQPFYLTKDNGQTLYPASINSFLIGYRLNDQNRAIASYFILAGKKEGYDKNIQLIDISNVLTKPIYTLTADTAQNSVLRGANPISIHKAWTGDGFINIIFDYKASPGSVHYINLIVDQENGPNPNPNGDSWYLDFVHDTKGDTGNRTFRGIVSFKIPEDLSADVTMIKITAKGENGQDELYELKYSKTPAGNEVVEISGITSEDYK